MFLLYTVFAASGLEGIIKLNDAGPDLINNRLTSSNMVLGPNDRFFLKYIITLICFNKAFNYNDRHKTALKM